MKADVELETYLSEAASWDSDRMTLLKRVARTGWVVAGAGWLCAIAGAVCLTLLIPLKTVEPFVVRVDNSTGIVDVVPVYTERTTPDEAVTRYFLTHYITVCERFNFQTAESDYEECGAFHTPQRNQTWYALWSANNPASPLNVHKDGSSVRASVQSVSFFKRATGLADLAQVRYLKSERQGSGGQERVTHWIATIQYAYGSPPKEARLRRWNPLGFKVVDISSEAEVVTPITASTAAATGSSP